MPPQAANVAVAPDLHVLRGPVPFPFEENRGQAPDDIAYVLHAGPMQVGFASRGPRFHLLNGPRCDGSTTPAAPLSAHAGHPEGSDPATCGQQPQGHTVALELLGVGDARPVGTVPSDTLVSYFKGQPDQWLVGVPAFQQVAYPNAWPGIDVAYERAASGLEAAYTLAPGADPSRIRLAWHGTDGASLSEDGALVLTTPVGTLRESSPVAWQDGPDGRRETVSARFDLLADGTDGGPVEVGLRLGTYDRTRPLTVDPAITYAGYIGGSDYDDVKGIAVDSSGAAYVAGETLASQASFPVLVGPDLTFNSGTDFYDAFVAKVKPDGSGLLYAGYIGGNQSDHGASIAIDSSGAAYVAGETTSNQASFPVLVGPGLTYSGGGSDAFVAKVKPDGSGLVYAGYIGAAGVDSAFGIAVDSSGAAYVAGSTTQPQAGFPVLVGPDLTYNGGNWDAFVAKVKPDGSGLAYAGYIGGTGSDFGNGIAVDSSGAAYVAGQTNSEQSSFPVLVGPDLTYNGPVGGSGTDAFVAKVKPDGSGLVYAGYIGGSNSDAAFGIVIDSSDAAYVEGETDSNQSSFPVLVGPDLTYNGNQDVFVAKVKPDGSGLIYAGYIGGGSIERRSGIALDSSGAAYVSGQTNSTDGSFPALGGPDVIFNAVADAFVAKVKPDGSGLVYAGSIGGSGDDITYANCIAVDSSGAVYVAGHTSAIETRFPVRVGPDLTHNGGIGFGSFDGFVAKVVDAATPTTGVSPGVTVTPTATVTPVITACTPRPRVEMQAVSTGDGRLRVILSVSSNPGFTNALQAITFNRLANASVLVDGTGRVSQGQRLTLPVGIQTAALSVSRGAPGQATTVQLTVTDACGNWPTFVGGGAGAF